MLLRRKLPLFSLIVLIILALVPAHAGMAQDDSEDCDDPFEGVQIQFDTSYWDETDFCQHSVPYEEIRSGGPPPDGIPPIDFPEFESIAEAEEWLQPQSPVIVVDINDEPRAYPLSILIYHEIVNDTFGDTPVAVTYCPLCNSAMVFDRRMDDETLRLGVSGNLRNFDMVMWDDVTESWWQQLTGEGIVGEYTGRQLTILPSLLVGFGDFVAQHPDGEVLSIPTQFNRTYGTTPYANFDTTNYIMPEGSRLPLTERVLAARIDGEAIAYPFIILLRDRVINDTLGGEEVVALWQPGAASAMDARMIDESFDTGMAALYERTIDDDTVLTFIITEDGEIRDEQTDSLWNVFGTAIDGELTGTQLRQVLAAPHFWFAWDAFYPETDVYGLDIVMEIFSNMSAETTEEPDDE